MQEKPGNKAHHIHMNLQSAEVIHPMVKKSFTNGSFGNLWGLIYGLLFLIPYAFVYYVLKIVLILIQCLNLLQNDVNMKKKSCSFSQCGPIFQNYSSLQTQSKAVKLLQGQC